MRDEASAAGFGDEARRLDAGHRRGLVIVGGVAGYAYRSEQRARLVANEHAARHRHEGAADGAGALLGAVGVTGDTSDNDEAAAVAGIEGAGLTAQVD